METVLLLWAGFVVVLILLRKIYNYILLARAKKIVEALGKISDALVLGTVEQVDDVYFVYNELTQEFLAQGRNWEEIRSHFKSRFPGKVCAIDREIADTIPKLASASE